MSEPGNNRLKINNLAARWFAAVVIYLVLESLTQPVIGCVNLKQDTNVTEIHRPSGLSLVGVKHAHPQPAYIREKMSLKYMPKFVAAVQEIAFGVNAKK